MNLVLIYSIKLSTPTGCLQIRPKRVTKQSVRRAHGVWIQLNFTDYFRIMRPRMVDLRCLVPRQKYFHRGRNVAFGVEIFLYLLKYFLSRLKHLYFGGNMSICVHIHCAIFYPGKNIFTWLDIDRSHILDTVVGDICNVQGLRTIITTHNNI